MALSKLNQITSNNPAIRILRNIQSHGFTSAILAGGAVRDSYLGKLVTDYDIYLRLPGGTDNTEQHTFPRVPLNSKVIDYIVGGADNVECRVNVEFTDDLEVVISSSDGDMISKDNIAPLDPYTVCPHVSQIWDVEKGYDLYQLIFIDINPISYVKNYFDIGICKAYCDGKKFTFLPEFFHDVKNKTLTICNAELTKKHFNTILEDHLQRLKDKFPGFKTVVHPENVKYITNSNKKYL